METIMMQIAEHAERCAAVLRAQGWQGGGATYELEASPGDLATLEETMGRSASREERLALERFIRADLNRKASAKMNIKAAMDLISSRALGNGWAEWTELCEAAEIEPCPLSFMTTKAAELVDELRRRGVRIHAPLGQATRFKAPR